MKNIEPSEPNDPLSKVLQDWKVSAQPPPRFQEQVWQRIARSQAAARPRPWVGVLGWLGQVLPRPAMAASYLTVLVAAGVIGGYWTGQEKAARLRDEMGLRYVQSVDPYQAVPSMR